MHPSEKNTNELTVRGGVNPYGQPDRKISGFFFTASLSFGCDLDEICTKIKVQCVYCLI